jgi:hypothetical protein
MEESVIFDVDAVMKILREGKGFECSGCCYYTTDISNQHNAEGLK